MEQSSKFPLYRLRGARPQPLPDEGRRRSSMRGSLILVGVMMAWVIVIIGLALGAGPGGSSTSPPAALGQGVVVTPASGWSSAAGEWNVGPGAVSFKRAGAYVAFAAQPFSGTNQDLLNEQLTALKQDFDTYRELPASQITISRDLPALSVLLTGSSKSSQLDCELVTATSAGTGVVMEAIAPTGQLSKVQNDLNQMLKTLQVPR